MMIPKSCTEQWVLRMVIGDSGAKGWKRGGGGGVSQLLIIAKLLDTRQVYVSMNCLLNVSPVVIGFQQKNRCWKYGLVQCIHLIAENDLRKKEKEKGRKQKQNTYESAYIITKRYYNIILFFTFTIKGSFQTKSDTLTRFTRIYKIIRLARIWPTYIARGEFCMQINMYLAFSFFFFNFAFCYDNVIAIEYIYLCTNVL